MHLQREKLLPSFFEHWVPMARGPIQHPVQRCTALGSDQRSWLPHANRDKTARHRTFTNRCPSRLQIASEQRNPPILNKDTSYSKIILDNFPAPNSCHALFRTLHALLLFQVLLEWIHCIRRPGYKILHWGMCVVHMFLFNCIYLLCFHLPFPVPHHNLPYHLSSLHRDVANTSPTHRPHYQRQRSSSGSEKTSPAQGGMFATNRQQSAHYTVHPDWASEALSHTYK